MWQNASQHKYIRNELFQRKIGEIYLSSHLCDNFLRCGNCFFNLLIIYELQILYLNCFADYIIVLFIMCWHAYWRETKGIKVTHNGSIWRYDLMKCVLEFGELWWFWLLFWNSAAPFLREYCQPVAHEHRKIVLGLLEG